MKMRWWAVVMVGAVLTLARPAWPARAHAELIASQPAAGAELTEAPAVVRLTFTDGLDPTSTVQVLDGQFRDVTAGGATVDPADPAVLSVALRALPAGEYTVQYQAVDPDDGHAVTGSFSFRLAGPAAAATAESTATPPAAAQAVTAPAAPAGARPPAVPQRPPWFYFLVGFVAVAGMLAFSVLRRRPPPPSPPLGPDDELGGGGA